MRLRVGVRFRQTSVDKKNDWVGQHRVHDFGYHVYSKVWWIESLNAIGGEDG